MITGTFQRQSQTKNAPKRTQSFETRIDQPTFLISSGGSRYSRAAQAATHSAIIQCKIASFVKNAREIESFPTPSYPFLVFLHTLSSQNQQSVQMPNEVP